VATVELRIAPRPEHVRTARLVAASMARRAGVDDGLIDEVKIAIGEACARAVAIHQEHCPDQPVILRGTDGGRDSTGLPCFVLEIEDEGPSEQDVPRDEVGLVPVAYTIVDLTSFTEPESADGTSVPAGIGLAMIVGLVDDLVVRPAEGETGTLVSMTWPLFLADLDVESAETRS
jgi:anti-sigma regulatory factor (Ser/Thr protein kinase)